MQKINLDNSQVPLHFQIADYLRVMLASGELSIDEPLIPEERLKEIFGVSRTTVRHAIDHLVQEGFLKRGRGRGTFWTESASSIRSEKLSGINRQIFGIDTVAEIMVFPRGMVIPPVEAAEFLGLIPGGKAISFERVRSKSSEPLSFTVNYIREEFGAKIKKSHLEKMTMLESLEKISAVKLGSIEHTVEVFRATQDVAAALRVSPLDPTLLVNTKVKNTDGDPVEFVNTYFVEDKYKFRVVLD